MSIASLRTARHDVLVAGAGPTGLVLALLARQVGLDVAVIEACEAMDTGPRAVMLHARAMEILDRLGLADRFLAQGLRQSVIAFARPDGLRLEMDFSRLPSRFPGLLNLRQPEMEHLLTEALLDMGGTVYRGIAVEGFRQTGGGVIVAVADTHGRQAAMECSWLFGCDGARSTVRTLLGAQFVGDTLPYLYLLGEGMPAMPLPHGAVSTMLITERGVVSWLPFRDGGIRVAGPGRAAVDATDDPPPALPIDTFLTEQSHLVPEPGLQVAEVHRTAHYKVHSRLATKWGDRRVWLAGDAAHVHPPAGGQALNLGWSDAEAIAIRLDGALGFGSYEDERRGIAEATLAHVAVMPLITAIRQARDDAQVEALQRNLNDMALRFSHLFTDYSAQGLDRLGSLDPTQRRALRVGRRIDGCHVLHPDPAQAGSCWTSEVPEQRVWLTPDRHVRRVEPRLVDTARMVQA